MNVVSSTSSMSCVSSHQPAPFFPLLHLPNKAIRRAMGYMNFMDFVCFSFTSKKTKLLTRSFNIRTKSFSISLQNRVVKILIVFRNLTELEWCLHTDRSVYGRYYDRTDHDPITRQCTQNIFAVRAWVLHLVYVFNCAEIDDVCFAHPYFKPRFVLRALKGTNFPTVTIKSHNSQYSELVLKSFVTMERLYLDRNPYQSSQEMHKLLIQNFELLHFGTSCHVEFNDLLVMNSKIVIINMSKLTNKEFNRFIKHWLKGSNKKLEYISIYSKSTDMSQMAVLNEVEYNIVPLEIRRIVPLPLRRCFPFNCVGLYGGFDIERRDGTKATIYITHIGSSFQFELLVWP